MFSRIKNFIKEYKELKYVAYHDTLTGLFNRTWLNKHIHSIKKNNVYFIDINNLHEINKKGHSTGDLYIKNIVKSIKIMLSDDDIFVRYAGDEFLIFSDNRSLVKSSEMYTVGQSFVVFSIEAAIVNADIRMIEQKNKR
jgi:diguanylate cyclase (GGDEF)-like protein